MNSSRNFWSIRVIIFTTSLRSILLIDLGRGPKSFVSRIKQGRSAIQYSERADLGPWASWVPKEEIHLDRSAYQPPVSTFLSEQTSHQHPVSSNFL
jgi:hypothetical protein